MDGSTCITNTSVERSLPVVYLATLQNLSILETAIGEHGIELILKEGIRVNGRDSNDGHVSADTTVQEKNFTFPTG